MRGVWLFLLSASLMILHDFESAVALTASTRQPSSHVSECDALLEFSKSFIIRKDASLFDCDEGRSICCSVTSYPKTALWENGTDCCLWDGVTCHTSTSSVISLDLSCSWLRGSLHSNGALFSLPSLRRLNLAGNDFENSQMSNRLGIFTGMTHLNLSSSNISGPIPLDVISQQLSTLVTLDLSLNYGDRLTIEHDHSFRRLMCNLSQLRELNLHAVDMSVVSPASFANISSTLTSLSLEGSFLEGTFPMSIFHLPNLRSLSLSSNDFLTGTLPRTNWSGPLVSLDVSYTNFHGSIPASLGTLTSMNFLDLSWANFTGPIPLELGNLARLAYLDLSENKLSGTVDFEMFALLNDLQYLSLEDNNLNVSLQSNGNCSFPRLQVLRLYNCSLTKFPYFLRSSKELVQLHLWRNMIQGGIPEWIGRVGRGTLIELYLSSNNITGDIPSSICQLISLDRLELNNNRLNGTTPGCLGNLSSLRYLDFSSNLLQGPLPRSLANCTSLYYLNLGSNNFHGAIEFPLSPRLLYLVIPNNDFSGPINFHLNSSADMIDLANNDFEGPPPVPPPRIEYYFIANNRFGGDIPLQLCNATLLKMIDLSNNRLTGSIPDCFRNLISGSLSVLDLRANKFVGQIPDIFALGYQLKTIRLSQNQLGGTLPRSLAHSYSLEVLDVSKNKLEDHFPYWLETLENLHVLDLRSNRFHGPVESFNSYPFPMLRILDLSDNRFSGRLPAEYMAKLQAMKIAETNDSQYVGRGVLYYQDSIAVVMKGLEMELVKILTLFTTIDLSSNFFEGEIPEVIGDLKALKGLNFSHNNLTGNIPSSMGNLTNLEWLDFSSNRLNGEIPRCLADLSFLSYLNLSNNQLVGQIPRSTQFDTFNHSFDENPGLCGHPLPKECGTATQPSTRSTSPAERDEEAESDSWFEWRAVPMGYGCGLALGISAWFIVLETGRPLWLLGMVENTIFRMKNRKKKNAASQNHARRTARGT